MRSFYFEHSAKQSNIHEVTPESDYVFVVWYGQCYYDPRYELSVTHCNIDVTWFPFDKQICHVVFVSYILISNNILLYPNHDYTRFYGDEPSDWTIESAYIKSLLHNIVCILSVS